MTGETAVPHGRWTASRKAKVVADIDTGAITEGDARRAFNLSEQELETWRRRLGTFGLPGLKAAHIHG